MLKIAFYKAIRPGVAGIYSHGVRLITQSPYSHCELIFSDGMSASSSFSDKGVRFKEIEYDPEKWDIIELPGFDEAAARAWFEEKDGAAYDLLGNVYFVFSLIHGRENKWFCSEACAAALGIPEPWRFDPGTLHAAILGLTANMARLQKLAA